MRRINSIVAVLVTLGISGACHAQSSTALDLTPYHIDVRAGIALPFESGLSNYGNPLMDLGIEYTLSESLLRTGQTYFSLDYFAKNLSFADGVLPICINQRFTINHHTGDTRRTYGFFGIGGADIAIGAANFVAAARAGLGADLSDQVFFELAGFISEKGTTATADAVTLSFGYRF